MVRSHMSFRAKRELLVQVAPRYQQAPPDQKSLILDEFVATTGYHRKYAIRLLVSPPLPPLPAIRRPRAPHYGPTVQAALEVAWAAANFIGSKRLVPFLPKLVPLLEQHGHLTLADDVRAQLLALSPATADRLLQRARRAAQPSGVSTTKPGTLLKRQIPVRTFAEWQDTAPGFLEIDVVAHGGTRVDGAFLSTLVLTDVCTGWVECQALLYRSQDQVLQAIRRARRLLPFPLLGLDSDNGGEFLNQELLDFCAQEQITFTRGRAYHKNDQCYVEQKNGAVVRQFVGYDRFEGDAAYQQLAELYRALRLYVNFLQPSMKLQAKQRSGGSVRRQYDVAQTPYERLCAADILSSTERARCDAMFAALDPVQLLAQIGRLQEALWQHAVVSGSGAAPAEAIAAPALAFSPAGCGARPSAEASHVDGQPTALPRQKRAYRRRQPHLPRWWRTRVDPFAEVWTEIEQTLEAQPERTAKSIFLELQQRYPGRFTDMQLRTLQRRIARWRATVIMTFDDAWLADEVLLDVAVPRPLRAVPLLPKHEPKSRSGPSY